MSVRHPEAYYRCQVHRDAGVQSAAHPKALYVREDALLPGVDAWLAELFDDDHLDETCEALAAAAAPDPALTGRHDELRRRIAELDTELESYRTVMRNEPDAASTVGKWIAQTSVERRRIESILRAQPSKQLTAEDIKALVASLRDIAEALQAADPAQKAEVYAELGISVTYHPDRRFLVEARPRVVDVGVGGATPTSTTRADRRNGDRQLMLRRGLQTA